ncbi:peptidase M23 [Enterococcus ureilyticus]|uniref:Peptidase M23 n=1 Tax=Enterococcus ureilyticus TaxID=1131292 RepID=A0A1E5HEE9_9ENTE|nr:3D (Asp-Asp-Asp) domain-containing protein/peptidoglycan hydrolase CwlO-like protein [Enterococcus ureilyticus]OEG23314.1 peptidase M23 [Enterococcus ureilyticus]
MKVKKLIPFLAAIMLVNVALPVGAAAESLDELKDKETQAAQTGESLSKDINTALNDVNEKYAEIEKLKADISKAEETIKNSEAEITVTEQSIARRKEVVGNRMKDIQLSGEQRTWQVLLDAESVSDFFNKAYAMTILQNAEQEKIDSLSKDKEKLSELQETVKNKQEELQTNETKLQDEASAMDEQVVTLKQQLSDNQAALQQIADQKQTEEKRITDEKNAAEARKQAEAAQSKAKTTVSSSSTSNSSSLSSDSSSSSSEEQPVVTPPSQPEEVPSAGGDTGQGNANGRVLYMQSTAYSFREAGSGYITATGIDLRSQSNVIAVDPSVIPLGSFVEVEGYGFAVAGDTGGAIKGNIIDVHFPSVDQCLTWGRRNNVKVTIQ